jgi:hypothetical protein
MHANLTALFTDAVGVTNSHRYSCRLCHTNGISDTYSDIHQHSQCHTYSYRYRTHPHLHRPAARRRRGRRRGRTARPAGRCY